MKYYLVEKQMVTGTQYDYVKSEYETIHSAFDTVEEVMEELQNNSDYKYNEEFDAYECGDHSIMIIIKRKQ